MASNHNADSPKSSKMVLHRFFPILPLLLTLSAFVIGMLCLFAGSKPGFMEDYDVVTLNASTLGYSTDDPEPTATAASATASPSQTGGFRNWLSDKAGNITDELSDKFDDFKDDLQDKAADKIADALGIQEWYSLHIMDMCMGSYSPNASENGASKNVSSCSQKKAMYKFDPTSRLEEELAQGPLGGRVTLEDLGYPDEIQSGINAINSLLGATFIFYVLGVAFSGLLLLTTLASIVLQIRIIKLINLLLSFLAFLCFGLGSAILTAFMVKASNLINEHGNEVGLYANKGSKFLAMTWAATGAIFMAWLGWIVLFILGRKRVDGSEKHDGHVRG